MKLRSPLRGLESREGKVHPLRRNLLLHLVLDRLFSHSGSARAPKRRHYSLDVSVLACPSTQQVRRPSQQLPHRVRCRLSTLLRSLLRFRLRGDTLVRVQIRVRLAGPNRIGGGVGSSLVRGSRLALRGCTATRLASPGTRAGYRESAAYGVIVSSRQLPPPVLPGLTEGGSESSCFRPRFLDWASPSCCCCCGSGVPPLEVEAAGISRPLPGSYEARLSRKACDQAEPRSSSLVCQSQVAVDQQSLELAANQRESERASH